MAKEEDMVYVRIMYNGYIPILKKNGPIKSTFVSKENFKELIQRGYDAMLLNRDACPEFYDQMVEYRQAIKNQEYASAEVIAESALSDNPNSVVKSAVASAKASGAALAPGSIIPSDAVASALATAGIAVSTASSADDTAGSYSSQLGCIDNAPDSIVDMSQPDLSENPKVEEVVAGDAASVDEPQPTMDEVAVQPETEVASEIESSASDEESESGEPSSEAVVEGQPMSKKAAKRAARAAARALAEASGSQQ